MDPLLLFDVATQKGNEFFQVWRTRNLGPTLGNPTAQMFTTIPADAHNPLIRELPFQKGVLQINSGTCFRTFTLNEIALRGQANCNPNAKCLGKRTPLCPENQDCHPETPQKPPKNPPTSPPCTAAQQAAQDAQNTACRNAQASWASLNSRAFTCNLNLPDPSPPAGCPVDCEIITLVPAGSKPCGFSDPPPGCDHETALEHNKQCRAKNATCP